MTNNRILQKGEVSNEMVWTIVQLKSLRSHVFVATNLRISKTQTDIGKTELPTKNE